MVTAVAISVLCKISEWRPAPYAAVLGLDEKVEENGEVGAAIGDPSGDADIEELAEL